MKKKYKDFQCDSSFLKIGKQKNEMVKNKLKFSNTNLLIPEKLR